MSKRFPVACVTAGVVWLMLLSAAGIASAGSSPAGTSSGSGAFVKAYSNIVGSTRFGLTPESVHATSDGGYIALASTQSAAPTRPSVSWLLKLSASGAPEWQRELGCLTTPPGDYALGSSIFQTRDGGYVVGGGTIGCGSASDCPVLSGVQCALVEKVDASGRVEWARVYNASPRGSGIDKIRQASDGGFIAVGSINDRNGTPKGLVLKLDSHGGVQWQRRLGPAGSTQVLLNDVRQTADGGYVVAGQLETPRSSALVVKLDSSGKVAWQRSVGAPTSSSTAYSIVQSADGGYLLAGFWDDSVAGSCCAGALLVKLDPSGNIRWQTALSGGLYCFDNGFSETCQNISGFVQTVHQTADGGYMLTGDENQELAPALPAGERPIEPWIAKVDQNGKLLWQHLYYQTNPSTGRPLGEYFADSTPAGDGGFFSLGFTENVTSGLGELFAVKTNGLGVAGSSCADMHPASALKPLNPALVATATSLPVTTTATSVSSSPATSAATSIRTQTDC